MKFTPLIVANWKMNTVKKEGDLSLAKDYVAVLGSGKSNLDERKIVICPSFLGITEVAHFLARKKNRSIILGAQDCAWEEKGAFTGEVSAKSLDFAGVRYVIVGHSERRSLMGETDEMISKKTAAIYRVSKNITPILCIGETLEQKNAGQTSDILEKQLKAVLEGLDLPAKRDLVIAYEPVWAIGTGDVISPEACGVTYGIIRKIVTQYQSSLVLGSSLKVLYGGSVTSTDVATLVQPGVSDGVLVGGASLRAREFKMLIDEAYQR